MSDDATTRLDLFDLAEANHTQVHIRFESICKARPRHESALRAFVEHASKARRVSMNMSPSKLRDLLTVGRCRTAREVAQKQAQKQNREIEDVFRERQGDWYAQRVAFEGSFQNGERFHYGALYIGAVGVEDYGDWCVIFGPDVEHDWKRLACLPGNSLERYAPPSQPVDRQGVQHDVAPWAGVVHLAAERHCDVLPGTPETGWAGVICHGYTFIEVITDAEIRATHIERIRIRDVRRRRLLELALRDLTEDPSLTQEERDEAATYAELIDALAGGRTRLEVVV